MRPKRTRTISAPPSSKFLFCESTPRPLTYRIKPTITARLRQSASSFLTVGFIGSSYPLDAFQSAGGFNETCFLLSTLCGTAGVIFLVAGRLFGHLLAPGDNESKA